jgi:DNA adenine methylase
VTAAPTRPVLRYFGGKWRQAPWIVRHLPPRRRYVEPFGGGASVLLRKEPSYAEVYNDLDEAVVDLFRILRDPRLAGVLASRLQFTAYARSEYELANEPIEVAAGDDAARLERARRLVVRSHMGHGSNSCFKPSGFRSNSDRSGSTPAHDWARLPVALEPVVERLRGVVIERKPALDLMAGLDAPDTLFYVDPPYLPETRGKRQRYSHEMDDLDHQYLLRALQGLQGMVALSGYPSDLYNARLPGWRVYEYQARADGAAKRTERLWLNPAAEAALHSARAVGPLYQAAGGGA